MVLAADGPEAFAALARYPDVELVILDLMLPGISGLEILSRLRADSQWQNVPCIVLTAAGQEAQLRDAEALGVAGVMTKPFSPRRLYERVLAVLHLGSPARPAPGATAPPIPT